MPDDGVIKFHCHWSKQQALDAGDVLPLASWRTDLYRRGWVGRNSEGIGYGNLSLRLGAAGLGKIFTEDEILAHTIKDPLRQWPFAITGSQTGHLANLGPEHYALVEQWNVARNEVHCRGMVQASSETLTHAALYEIDPGIGAIFHIHNLKAWQSLLRVIPTTRAEVPYGTPQMAQEMERLFVEEGLGHVGVLAMAGHQEGILAFGKDPDEAGERLLRIMA